MPKTYRYKITLEATASMNRIFDYIAQQLYNPDAALSLISEMEEAIQSLCEFPYRHELSQDPLLRLRGYRPIYVGNYVILYHVIEEDALIIVSGVFYGAMDYSKYL